VVLLSISVTVNIRKEGYKIIWNKRN